MASMFDECPNRKTLQAPPLDAETTTTNTQNKSSESEPRLRNVQLTSEQKRQKRELKRHLKLQRKIHKLQTRARHAKSRSDPQMERQAQEDLSRLLEEHAAKKQDADCAEGVIAVPSHAISPRTHHKDDRDDLQFQTRKQFLMDTIAALTATFSSNTDNAHDESHKQTSELLQHMTKGTQTLPMFANQAALFGYARRKMLERGMLVGNALSRLQHYDNDEFQGEHLWGRICQVNRACSIGCGPGNDMLGFLGLLLSLSQTQDAGKGKPAPPVLEECLLLDWAISDWNAILQPLSKLLMQQAQPTMNIGTRLPLVGKWTSAQCDVCQPFPPVQPQVTDCKDTPSNESHSNTDTEMGHGKRNLPMNHSLLAFFDPLHESCISHKNDIVLISYVLSETRYKWIPFVLELFQRAHYDTLFYFAEPTPWQLHRVMQEVQHCLDQGSVSGQEERDGPWSCMDVTFQWLDSSMHDKAMQALEGRVGPAVLLALKTRKLTNDKMVVKSI